MRKKSGRLIKRIAVLIITVAVLAALFVGISNYLIVNTYKAQIVSDEEIKDYKAECILILGAGVWEGNKPSPMLVDRLNQGLKLYQSKAAGKIIVSGDHGSVNYNEVGVMKQYLIDAGVQSQDIFMDHAGFSTYESMYRAKEIFGVNKLIVVTQEYHMYRALYICDQLGIEARGSSADPRKYAGALARNIRELLARDKDIFSCIFKVQPSYLGDPIDINGDGDVTND